MTRRDLRVDQRRRAGSRSPCPRAPSRSVGIIATRRSARWASRGSWSTTWVSGSATVIAATALATDPVRGTPASSRPSTRQRGRANAGAPACVAPRPGVARNGTGRRRRRDRGARRSRARRSPSPRSRSRPGSPPAESWRATTGCRRARIATGRRGTSWSGSTRTRPLATGIAKLRANPAVVAAAGYYEQSDIATVDGRDTFFLIASTTTSGTLDP